MDFEALNIELCQNSVALLEGWLPGGTIEKGTYKPINPVREDQRAGSFVIDLKDGHWIDFASGDKGGDLISLYAYINGISQGDAAKDLKGENYRDLPKNPTTVHKPKREFVQVFDIPKDAWRSAPKAFPKKENGKWVEYPFIKKWPYHTDRGAVFGYIGRIEKDGKKETIPVGYYRDENDKGVWKFKAFDSPRRLYNLHSIKIQPKAQIFLVEGEKCAEALQKIMGQSAVVTTWSGGSSGTKLADFTPLRGRSVIIWPDWDEPGLKAANQLKTILEKIGVTRLGCIRLDNLDRQPKKGWDCADLIESFPNSEKRVFEFIKRQIENDFTGFDIGRIFSKTVAPKIAKENGPPIQEPPPPQEPPAEIENEEQPALESAPFRCLGYDHGIHYYFPWESKQVIPLRADQHSKLHFLSLARSPFWEANWSNKKGCDWEAVANDVMAASHKAGVYNATQIRGCGAWYDAKRVVLHFGDRLKVDGNFISLSDFKTKYIYEAAPPQAMTNENPATAENAKRLFEICQKLKWEKSVFGTMLAGWVALAPICGALNWRPHIWISGGAGTGKTFVMNDIIRTVLGSTSVYVQSATSEAGIRQQLKNDALPVLFDESEGEDKASQKRIQTVLELMRQASSDTGGAILKGTTSGKAMSFKIRSMFCLSSIGVALTQHADQSRISVLTLSTPDSSKQEENAEHFKNLQDAINNTLSTRYCASIRSRSIKMIPLIRKNAKVFARAAAEILGNQRIGDQMGTLLAGAFSLTEDHEISLPLAREWIEKEEWEEERQIGNVRDEMSCLNEILQFTLRVTTATSIYDSSIAELLIAARHVQQDVLDTGEGEVPKHHADLTLRRWGIRYMDKEGMIAISDSHSGVKKMLRETPWVKTSGRILRRIESTELINSMRFLGVTTRATAIPWTSAFPGDILNDGQ